jgi:hypothetical protein
MEGFEKQHIKKLKYTSPTDINSINIYEHTRLDDGIVRVKAYDGVNANGVVKECDCLFRLDTNRGKQHIKKLKYTSPTDINSMNYIEG